MRISLSRPIGNIAAIAVAVAVLGLAGCATRTRAPVDERAPVPPPPIATTPAPVPAAPVAAQPQPPAPPEKDWRPEFYAVKRGDTLYQIALEHGLDYRELAAMNNIDNINLIRVGQVLRMRPPTDPAPTGAGQTPERPAEVRAAAPEREPRPTGPAGRGNTDTYKSGPKAVKLPFSDAALAQLSASAMKDGAAPPSSAPRDAGAVPSANPATAAPAFPSPASMPTTPSAPAAIGPLASAAPASSVPSAPPAPPPSAQSSAPPLAPTAPPADAGDDRVDWSWPVRGKLINGYSESASLKGIDIGGAAGVPIVASAPGKVVYAGSGLRGYGKLVIVKHNKTYLSAYAHLDQITVKEGQMIGKGQELGKMGNTDADQVKLHFEIRSLGKPVDPLRYLPRG